MLVSTSILFANPDSFIGIKAFSVTIPESSDYSQFHTELFKRLQHEIIPHGIIPVLLHEADTVSCIAYAEGVIEMHNDVLTLLFRLTNHESEEETKLIALADRSKDEILDIMALKIRQFLEQNHTGRVRISSVPLDCDILLNGIRIGTTPAELVLEKGTYSVRLEKEFLSPYIDSIIIVPGNEAALQAQMQFSGHRVKPWAAAASLFTAATIVLWIVENNLHQDYRDLTHGTSQSEFNSQYNRYRNANYIRVGLLNASVLGWTVSAYQYTRNKALKRRIFGRESK